MKNKIKIFIALGITLITTLIFTVSTFAYTSNTLSNTLEYTTTDNDYIYFNLNNAIENKEKTKVYLLINIQPTNTTTGQFTLDISYNNSTYSNLFQLSRWINTNNDIATTIINPTGNGTTSIDKIRLKIQASTYKTINDIINIDLVYANDITTIQYLNIYSQNLQNQLDTLTNQYDTLSNNYEQLENDYDTLNSNYETLNDNYEQLESNYETLNDNYEQLEEDYYNINNSYYQYIIGNNYFNNSETSFYQTTNGTWYETWQDIAMSSNPLQTPNTYLNENILNLSQLFNYIYNNGEAFNSSFQLVNIYNHPNYSTSNYTYLKINPHYNLPSNVILSGAMPLKYVNMTIIGNNYQGNIRIEVTEQGQSANEPTYINIERDVNGNYNINYPDSEYYLNAIDIQAIYENGAYNVPTEIISNVERIKAVTDYQIGYDTAKSEYENSLNTTIRNNEELINANRLLEEQYRELIERYNRINENDNELYNMVIAVADTPISIFQQIFNFDILGINITQIVTMIITILVIVWLIKKLI